MRGQHFTKYGEPACQQTNITEPQINIFLDRTLVEQHSAFISILKSGYTGQNAVLTALLILVE